MPSLSGLDDRHVIIDRREGVYLAFPDVIRADDGSLVAVYNEADRHIRPARRVIVASRSEDNGLTWAAPAYPESGTSHCPRLQRLADGTLLVSDSSCVFFESPDNGRTFLPFRAEGLTHDMHDRVLVLDGDVWLTTGHKHVGNEEHPAIRQPPTEQVVFRSTDRGRTWERVATMGAARNLVLCEASMTLLPSGRILALLRENCFVYEPMHCCHSDDNGVTWSEPAPTALIGHRPTMGRLPDGRLLITYRNTGPDWGTCAWVGTPEELCSGYRVHGRAADPANPVFTPDGMRVRNDEGEDAVVRFALRPMTDPRSATAILETEVRVDRAGENGCGVRLGVWWRLYQDRMVPDSEDADPIPLEPGRFNRLRFEYADGKVTPWVNGEPRDAVEVDPDHADTRPILFGAPYPFEDNAVDCAWRSVSLRVLEPACDRVYAWDWTAGDGLPDQWVRDNVLELRNDRSASIPDFGYSGWADLGDGRFFCAYHHGGGDEPGYEPLETAHVAGTFFTLDDFNRG